MIYITPLILCVNGSERRRYWYWVWYSQKVLGQYQYYPIPPNIAQYPNASIVLTLAMETKVPQFKTENPHLTAYISEPI